MEKYLYINFGRLIFLYSFIFYKMQEMVQTSVINKFKNIKVGT